MRKPVRGDSDSPPAQAGHENHGAFDQARALFETMAGEAVRQSETEREKAKSRGAAARLLLALTIAACLLAAATMFYGVYNFPDAPIRQTAAGYSGKGGTARTQEDFEAFIIWQKAMLLVFPTVFVLGFAFAITDALQRRKGRG